MDVMTNHRKQLGIIDNMNNLCREVGFMRCALPIKGDVVAETAHRRLALLVLGPGKHHSTDIRNGSPF